MFSRIMFSTMNFAARRGFADPFQPTEIANSRSASKLAARQRGIHGETFAYWFLRRHGYIIIARNFTVAGIKGELDLVGYDREILAFVEVKLRSIQPNETSRSTPQPLPEEAVGPAKRRDLIRMAKQFLSHWRKHKGICRFDLLAIEARYGKAPIVRLHKDAFPMHI